MQFRCWLTENERPIKVIDTATLTPDDQWKLGYAAIAGNGEIKGYHVSDDPEALSQVIQGPKKITATYKGGGRTAELGPGLYISAVPEYWGGRATKKWDFLSRLTPDERQRLASALMNDRRLAGEEYVDSHTGQKKMFKYVSDHERDYAIRDIRNWLAHPDNPGLIVGISGQPFNIKFWEPEFLEKIGIKPGEPIRHMEIKARGKFVDLSDTPQPGLNAIAKLIKAGYDGAFTKSGFSTNPELVIWNKKAITYHG